MPQHPRLNQPRRPWRVSLGSVNSITSFASKKRALEDAQERANLWGRSFFVRHATDDREPVIEVRPSEESS